MLLYSMRVLDIGCDWGGFAKYAAGKYGAHIHGITVSGEQLKFANKHCQGLDVKIELKDYRDLTEKYDRIVSIGMFEHVGQYYDKTLMAWYKNFTTNWTKLKDMYDERFYRMWTYSLLSSAGGFRSRSTQLWQIVFSKNGIKGGFFCRG